MSKERDYSCSVCGLDETTTYKWSGKATSAREAAQLAAEAAFYQGELGDGDEFGVKTVAAATGDVSFFDVSIEVTVDAYAMPVDAEEQTRRIAEHNENEAVA